MKDETKRNKTKSKKEAIRYAPTYSGVVFQVTYIIQTMFYIVYGRNSFFKKMHFIYILEKIKLYLNMENIHLHYLHQEFKRKNLFICL